MCIGLINWLSAIVLFASVNFCLIAKIILRLFLVFIILRFDKLSKMNITIIFLLSVCDASVIYVNLQVNAWCFLFSDLHCDSFAIVQLFVAKKFQYELTVMLMRNKVITSLKFYTCYAVLGLRLNLQVKK